MRVLKKLFTACALLCSMPAWSIPLSTVGGIDTLIAQTTLQNSGTGTEVSWIEGVLGIDIDDQAYTQTSVGAGDWQAVDNMLGVFASELVSDSDYFLIKIGANSGATSTHFLFSNLPSLSWAVIDLEAMGFNARNITNIGKVSHIGTSSGTTSVPEPASIVLFGLGALGLGLTRRRRPS